MGDVIKLRTARKAAKRRQDAEQAAANRLGHGRTKAQRKLDQARTDKAQRELDAHKIETGER